MTHAAAPVQLLTGGGVGQVPTVTRAALQDMWAMDSLGLLLSGALWVRLASSSGPASSGVEAARLWLCLVPPEGRPSSAGSRPGPRAAHQCRSLLAEHQVSTAL